MAWNARWILLGGLLGLALAAARWSRRFFWGYALLVLPGTLAHEGCHFLMGLALHGRPTGFSVVPRRHQDGYALGAVTFAHARWYNTFFIGMAPLLLLPAAWALARWRFSPSAAPVLFQDWRQGLDFYLVANLVGASLPSRQDLRVAARSPVGWILLAGALAWGWTRVRGPRPQPPPVVSRTS